MNTRPFAKWLIFSLCVAAVLIGGMIRINRPPGENSRAKTGELDVWCAAALKLPMEELALRYEREHGTKINLQYGGSGTLLASIETTRRGDLFIPADNSYAEILISKNLGNESILLATLNPVLAVAKGNPKNIKGWKDVIGRQDIRFGLCHPETAAIGRKIKHIADSHNAWSALQQRAIVSKTTVTELANDLQAGALDVTFLWDQTVASMPGLEAIPCAELAGHPVMVPATVLRSASSPTAALHFARWIALPEHGAPVFRNHGFGAGKGGIRQESPERLLSSGGVGCQAVEAALMEPIDPPGSKEQ